MDCRSRDADKREIYIVEGDSALGSVKLSRDAEYQGIMPVRGKILNCLKADYARIFKSEIITDLIKVLGCGVEVEKHGKELNNFSLENLRWNKVVVCTDADVDGYQIRTLILTMLWRLVPTLIREGYVYIAESPLYEIQAKGKTWFAYSDREKAEIVESIGNAKIVINRSKGLSETRPGDDVAHHNEPRDPAAYPRHARGRRRNGARFRSPARRQSRRTQGAHRRGRQPVSRSGRPS